MRQYLLLLLMFFISVLCFAENDQGTFSTTGLNSDNYEECLISYLESTIEESFYNNPIHEAEADLYFGEITYSDVWAEIASNPNNLVDETTKAEELHRFVEENNRIVELFKPKESYDLPIGIAQNIAGITFIVTIDSIIYTPKGAEMRAYMCIDVPGANMKISFKGEHIKFNPAGISGAQLKPLKDYPLNLSANTQLIVRQSKTYVEFDCNGYKETSLFAEVTIDTALLYPIDANGNVIKKNSQVSATFQTVFYDWNDIIVEINLTPFEVKGLDGFQFHISQAVIDLSDMRNIQGMVFPPGYTSTTIPAAGSPLWRGFYLRQFTVTLPEELGSDIKFQASNMVIDNMGLSGTFSALNLIPISKGNIKGWGFSMEKLSANLVANQIEKIEFNGVIQIPLEKDAATGFKYKACIAKGGNYLFNVSMGREIDAKLWLAKMKIFNSSNIEISKVDGKLLPKAVINGKLTVGAEGEGKVNVGLEFQEMTIQTVAPKFKVRAVKFAGNVQPMFNDFPIDITDVNFVENEKEGTTGLAFNACLNLMDKNSGFKADGAFTIWAEEYEQNNKSRWRYKRLDVSSFGINIKTAAFAFEGSLTIYNEDKVYGNGFNGSVKAWFTPGINISAYAQFGSVNGMRYWSVDALATTHKGIKVCTGFGVYGFGGGAYYHMKQKSGLPSHLPTVKSITTDSIAGGFMSGIEYVPDQDTYLGIKATVIVGTYPEPDALNGDATFEIAFNNYGGIRRVAFKGRAFFMKKLKLDDPSSNEANTISAEMLIEYVVPDKSLYGCFKVHMDIKGVIKGTGPNNLAGNVELFFSPSDWFLKIGTPKKRVGVEIAKLINMQAYLMVGTDIPGMPPPPPEVARILDCDNLNFMRNENALRKGSGFAFGASTSFNTGELTFLIFYAKFAGGVGFDIMLKNYGPDAHCKGRSSTLGINGWYASGQVYAFVEGDIGIKVTLFGSTKKFEIIDLKAAAILQAKLPNPTWLRGIVGGKYSILGGLISGSCKFQFTIGEECDLGDGSVVGGITAISEVSPFNGSKDISVFNNPQVAFNMRINKEFKFIGDDGIKKSYIIKLDHFKVLNQGQQIVGNYKWNDDGLVYVFKSHEVLPPEKEIFIEAKVHFEVYEKGRWQSVRNATEMLSAKFTTGEAPDHIPQKNVVYNYPFKNQTNFYPEQSYKGYIQLDKGQSYLFKFEKYKGWRQTARVKSGNTKEFGFKYSESLKRVTYTLPKGISTGKSCKFSIVNVAPKQGNKQIDRNVKDKVDRRSEAEIVTTQDIEGELVQLEDKDIYACDFKTSKYKTLKDKLNAFSKSSSFARVKNETAVFDLFLVLSGGENFSNSEIRGGYIEGNKYEPLIQFEALTDNKWFKDKLFPTIYGGFKENNMSITWRNSSILDIPPLKAIKIFGNKRDMKYYLPWIVGYDQVEVSNQAAVLIANGISNSFLRRALIAGFPFINTHSKYKFKVYYVLPGINERSSSSILKIDY